MSLINQMLKELDARSSEAGGVSAAYGHQIRAVPERRRMHPAWWIALALAVLLIAVLAWLLMRTPTQARQSDGARLKIDTGLESLPAPKTGADAPVKSPPVTQVAAVAPPTAVDIPQPANPATRVATVSATEGTAHPSTGIAPNISSLKPAPKLQPEKATEPQPTGDNFKSIPAPKPAPQVKEARLPESVAVTVNKQIKEPTPQQRGENEYRKAVSLMQQGKNNDAIAALEQALQFDAKNFAARQALIGLLVEGKRQDDAMQQAREGLQLDPAQPGLAMILARLQVEKNSLPSAIETLERSLPYGAERADYQAFLAALLQRDGKHQQATEHYLLALQKTPQNGVWWMGLGISFQAGNRAAEALEAYKRAKASNSLSPELLAFVEGRIGQLQR